MAHIPWTLYAMRLQRVAQKMANARDADAVAQCLQEHSALWDRISGLITEAEEEGSRGLRRQMAPLTRLVAISPDHGSPEAEPLSGQGAPEANNPPQGAASSARDWAGATRDTVSALIALNRQAAALLPDLELGMPVRQWLN